MNLKDNMRIHLPESSYILLTLLTFLIGLNFLGLGSKLQLALICVVLFQMPRKLRVDVSAVFLFLFVTAYAMGIMLNDTLSITKVSTRVVAPLLMYYVGALLAKKRSDINHLKNGAFIFFSGYALQSLAVLFRSIISGNDNRMNIIDMWGGGIQTAIQQTASFTCFAALLVYFICYERNKAYKWCGVFLFAMTVINSMYFASRTGIVVIGVTNSCALLYTLATGELQQKKKIVTVCILAGCITMLLQYMGIINIASLWENSNLYNRMFISKAGMDSMSRPALWMKGFQELLQNPFGSEYRYAHNLWIDVGLEAGIVPMIMLVCFSIVNIRNVILLMKNKDANQGTKIIILSLTIAYMTAFSVEPMMEGMPLLVAAYIGYCGMVNTYVYPQRKDLL